MKSSPSAAKNGPRETRHRVIIVDDHPLLRRGMAALLSDQPDLDVCGEAQDARGALQAMRDLTPDVALIDINLPGANGLELIKLMLAEQPKLRILVVSMHDESLYALRSLRAGREGLSHEGRGARADGRRRAPRRAGRHLRHAPLQ